MSVAVSIPKSSVFFKGEEDAVSAGPRRLAIRHCLQSGARKLTIDLGEATFLDASAVADLIYLANYLALHGRQLEIRRSSREIGKLLQMAGLNKIESVHLIPSAVHTHSDDELSYAG